MVNLKGRDVHFFKREKWRKFGGWLVGAYGVIAIILSLLTVILLSVGIYFLIEAGKTNDPANMYGGAVIGCLLVMAIAGIILFTLTAIFQILKVISGVLVYKGKRKIAVMFLTMIGICAAFFFTLITAMLTFLMSPLFVIVSILLGFLDLAIWGFMIWVLVYSDETFEKETGKKMSKGKKPNRKKKARTIVWED